MASTAIITGVTGQDGYYLARLLCLRGYQVIGLVRPETYWRHEFQHGFAQELPEVTFRPFDLSEVHQWADLFSEYQPQEFYHLAAMSFIPDSWLNPLSASQANFDVTIHLLEAMRTSSPQTRMFYACSSEIFGRPDSGPQNELTRLHPTTPYGVTKAASHCMVDVYRTRYDLHVNSGILFNHESPRRSLSFVFRKISAAAAAIASGQQDELMMGNLDSARDWGYAVDFVDCMWRIVQSPTPADYVIGTGKLTTIRQLLDIAFEYVDLKWQDYVTIDPNLMRRVDSAKLYADSSLARENLGWEPSIDVQQLMHLMIDEDLNRCRTALRRDAA